MRNFIHTKIFTYTVYVFMYVCMYLCVSMCIYVCFACIHLLFYRNSRDILCVSYEPSGICKNFFSTYYNHPVTFAVNTSHYGDISTYQDTFTFYNYFLSDVLSASKRCLDALIPFLCRRIFSTCDPAFNQSVEQRICRRACETLTVFVCPEVTTVVLEQSSNLNFMMLGAPRCDGLMNANGGDAPDCIDSLDGGM